jgi:hypothetical protein
MRITTAFALALFLLGITRVAEAQIPNAGFEAWVNGEPTGWLTPNIPGPAQREPRHPRRS